ncbi:MAG TPA: protein-L-isoaspartate O-methyltransferase [Burkholderiales bacterium]|nr:protein-L-isoaspartate O-methyltransferase [Burkholderiales bacterium]
MNLEQARANMVEQQIRPWEVLDQAVLDLLYAVPREEFVPAACRNLAFADLEIPIGEGERMMAPKIEARLLQSLALRKTDRVLEVGTGSGYLTALLARSAVHVHSLEIRPALAAFGRGNLERQGVDNVTLEIGDGARGDPKRAPYDAIVLTGSTPVLPATLREQLAPGGRLFAVVGEPPVMVARLVTCTAPGTYGAADLFDTLLAPLANAERAPQFRF